MTNREIACNIYWAYPQDPATTTNAITAALDIKDARIAELERDRERLDFMEHAALQSDTGHPENGWLFTSGQFDHATWPADLYPKHLVTKTLRACIDAAIERERSGAK